jgi:hypothetical protein
MHKQASGTLRKRPRTLTMATSGPNDIGYRMSHRTNMQRVARACGLVRRPTLVQERVSVLACRPLCPATHRQLGEHLQP